MAGGYGFKQGVLLTAKALNDVNDTVSGGAIFSIPSGVQAPPYSQTLPGDRIILDDATALALSDTTVGTLYGGTYQYYGTYASATAAPALGAGAFYRAADLPPAVSNLYRVTSDAQATAAIPTLIAGVFINAITKGNWGWIQTGGVVSCLFDHTITAAAVGNGVTTKISPTTAGSFDVGAALAATTAGAIAGVDTLVGIAIVLPVIDTVTAVLWTRGNVYQR